MPADLRTMNFGPWSAGPFVDVLHFAFTVEWSSRESWPVCEQDIPKDAEANMLEIPVSVFDGVLDLIEGCPDWDGEDVANESSWC